jgi:hypothetical protein
VDVIEVLNAEREAIIEAAAKSLGRSNVPHYAEAGASLSRDRLAELYELLVESVTKRDLRPMIEHSERVARERFAAGFDIREVQIAFNVLEEATWAAVVDAVPPRDLAQAIGMVGTAVGAGRDALARAYVSLASHEHVRSLDLSALFRGVS